MSVPLTSLYIDGQYRPASDSSTYEVCNPYSQEIVGIAAAATSQDCKDAVEAAQRAYRSWDNTPLNTRREVFLKAAELIQEDKYKLKFGAALQEETAAVDFIVIFNIMVAVDWLRVYAGMALEYKSQTFPSINPGGHVVEVRKAKGVVFAIAPWNAPLILTLRAIGVPILCGNAVVLKCSEASPRSQAIVTELFKEAGLPDGVLNFISTSRTDAPTRVSEIITHPLVKVINFTGSDVVGKVIAAEAAKYLKPCVLELGGKSAVVVLEDADIERAARAITSSALAHSGQVCMSTERVIVSRKVAPALKSALAALFNRLRAGGPGSGSDLSALFREDSAAKVMDMIKDATEKGATLLAGDGTRDGAIVQPHLVADVTTDMWIWNRETFGPVVTVIEFDTVEEAIELANSTDYSLTSALWTQNINATLDVGSRIRASVVNVNGPTIHFEGTSVGMAGLGGATGYGHFDVDSFTDVKSLVIHPAMNLPYPFVG
ncbi:aldehyde dehydrogenase [Obba rivulosa]|uniref:Aldehyde dehydrogenase n=1 Tax=Obba rivulosa TaxID=1052685 RepID=A0A8E2AQX7_9APHY|nr:aldehyde dehydrogenase [Obba rivulosa]